MTESYESGNWKVVPLDLYRESADVYTMGLDNSWRKLVGISFRDVDDMVKALRAYQKTFEQYFEMYGIKGADND